MTEAASASARAPRLAPSERFLAAALVGLLLLAPVHMGANRLVSASALSLAAALLLACWAVQVGRGRIAARLEPGRLAWVAVPFLAAVAWIVVQIVPLPAGSALAHPVWAAAQATLGRELPHSISLAPEDTRYHLMRLLAYAAVFLVAAELGRSRRLSQGLLTGVLAVVAVHCLYGVLEHAVSAEWDAPPEYAGERANGTFPNPNSFGMFAGTGVVLALGLALDRLAGAVAAEGSPAAFARRLARASGRSALLWTVGALCLLALWQSGSRGALLSTGAGVMVLLVCLALSGRLQLRLIAPAALAMAAVLVFLSNTAGQSTFDRYGQPVLESDRFGAFGRVAEAVLHAPWPGTGFGTFATAYEFLRSPQTPAPRVFLENMYLESALELGIPGAAVLMLAPGVAVVVMLLGVRRRRRDVHIPATACGVVALAACHSLVDLSLAMPALAAQFAAVLGIGFAQSFPTRARDDEHLRQPVVAPGAGTGPAP